VSEIQHIFKNTAVLAASRLVEKTCSMVLALAIARTLHASGFGVYTTAMAYYLLIALAVEMGMGNLLVREIAKNPAETSRYLVHAGIMAVAAAAVVMPTGLAIVAYLGYSGELALSVYVIALAVIPGTLNAFQEAVLVAHQRLEFLGWISCAAAGLNIGASLFLLASGHGVISLLSVFVAIQCLVAVSYLGVIHKRVASLQWEFRWSFAHDLLRDVKPFAASSVLAGLFTRPEIILLSLLRAPTQVGFYSAALKLVDLWYMVPQVYMTNVFPILTRSYHMGDPGVQSIQDTSLKYLLAFSLPVTAGLAVAAPAIISLAYGSEFAPAVILLRLLALNATLDSVQAVLWRVLSARGQQRLVVRAQIVTAFTRTASGYLSIKSFGTVGAAVSTPANLLLHCGLLTFYVTRGGTHLYLWRLAWRFALAALVMAAVVSMVGAVHIWLVLPFAGMMYAGMVIWLRALAPEEIDVLARVWRRVLFPLR
jgi:O-antigen/teichoic acid export membrane protein